VSVVKYRPFAKSCGAGIVFVPLNAIECDSSDTQ